jgi:hypothetical protein
VNLEGKTPRDLAPLARAPRLRKLSIRLSPGFESRAPLIDLLPGVEIDVTPRTRPTPSSDDDDYYGGGAI